MNPREEYGRRLEGRRASAAILDKKHHRVGFARVAMAVCAAVSVGVFVMGRFPFSAWWLLTPLPVIFFLGVWLERLEEHSAELSRAVGFYERAIARIEGRWAGTGPSGARFLDEGHVYSCDLDLFGEGSLFDLLSNARTTMGEETLARWLLHPAPPPDVLARQEAVAELAPRVDFHEQLAVFPDDVPKGVKPASLAAWGAEPLALQSRVVRIALWSLSLLGLVVLVGIVAFLVAPEGSMVLTESTASALRAFFLMFVIAITLIQWRLRKQTEQIIARADAATAKLGLLAKILRLVEVEPFASPRLTTLRAVLETNGRPPSWRIAKLERLMNIADMRHNWFVRVLGPLLLFDLHVACQLEDWRRISGASVARWLEVVGDVEALSSLANYRYGRPDHVFPEFVAGSPWFEADAIGHPLLERAVTNDVAITGQLQLLIVSGSNMSGKSTMLRTIGVNAVLAQAGGPVFATRMRLSTLWVAASIRVQDSLREGRSGFYAEILRLKQIMDTARDGPPALFLVDEILHGTNSQDRSVGAAAIVRGLVERGAIGLITTHDLALTNIAASLDSRALNVHFQDYVENGRLHYDYKMRPGVVARSNAIELMRSIGLDV